MTKDRRKYHEQERVVRGFSNHRRIEILNLLVEQPNLSVIEISKKLEVNFKTISEHVRRLSIAGLVFKHAEGNAVRHELTNRAKSTLKFLRTLE